MATRTRPPEDTELKELERDALEGLAEEGIAGPEEEPRDRFFQEEEPGLPLKRLAAVVSFPTLAAAVMAGGVFVQLSARFWGAIAGLAGIGIGVAAHKTRKLSLMSAVALGGIFLIGLALVIPAGFGNLFDLGRVVKSAVTEGDIHRPPVEFSAGWRSIMGWLMASLGFAVAWVAIELKRPALAVMIPLPVVAFTAISVPDTDQIVTGIASLVFFVIGLGLLSGTDIGGDQDQKPSLAFELRRAAKALPLMLAMVAALYGLSRTNLLFPPPLYDPTQEAKKPKTVPLSEVPDEVLFKVKATISGPWRMGHLDVYDESDHSWRLPPFAQTQLEEVPKSGVVDSELQPGVRADFEVFGLEGAVLPGLPNTVGIVAEGPRLAFDERLGNIRLKVGQITPSLKYVVVAGAVPEVEALRKISGSVPNNILPFLKSPAPPPAVERLLAEAPQENRWDKFDYVRQKFLATVVSSGAGNPVEVPPEKIQDMLAGSKEGTPFEIVAAQAMMARWAGIPSRIGYGFDGGDKLEGSDAFEVRPKHGATFLEVYFPGHKWLPVIGTPLQAKPKLSDEFSQFNPNVAASDDLAVRVLVPVALDPATFLFSQIRAVLMVVVPLLLLILGIYYTWPAVRKAVARSRRRSLAAHQGAEARVALAYAEWRDTATDFGYKYEADTPLMFLDRVVEDDEHTEFAWLVTRCLWGDLQEVVTESDAGAAEELSKSLRKRLSGAHPYTFRFIAAVSRLSIRYPFAPQPRAGSTKPPAVRRRLALEGG